MKIKEKFNIDVNFFYIEIEKEINNIKQVEFKYLKDERYLVYIVYENDEFECEYGLEPKLTHTPADRDRGEPIKVYAVFKTKSGGYGFEVMSMDDVRNHASKYSKSYGSSFSPWKTNFEEMAKKTVLKRVLKYAPLKSDFVRGITQDESIKTEIADDMYSVPNEVVYETDYVEVDKNTGEVTDDDSARSDS